MHAPTIRQQHVDHITAIAHKLARTPLGRLVGADELVSEAGTVLWDLARTYKPRHEHSTFVGYIAYYGELRLRDKIRSRVGRYGTQRLAASFREPIPLDEDYTDTNSLTFADPGPSPEEIVEAKETEAETHAEAREMLRQVYDYADKELTPRQRAAILSDDDRATADEWGMSVATLMTHRSHARARIRQALGARLPTQRKHK